MAKVEVDERDRKQDTAQFHGAPPPRKDLPQEFEGTSDEAVRDASEKLFAFLLKILKSRSRAQALYWRVWGEVLTKRRWDPSKAPLLPWLFICAKYLYKDDLRAQERDERNEAAHEGFHGEIAPQMSVSAEDQAVDHDERDEEHDAAKEIADLLRERAAKDPIALQVLELRLEGCDTPAVVAPLLGVPVKEVYRVNELIGRWLKEIKKAWHAGPKPPEKP